MRSSCLLAVLLLCAAAGGAESVFFRSDSGAALDTVEMLRSFHRWLGDLFSKGPLPPRNVLIDLESTSGGSPVSGMLTVPLDPGKLKRRELKEMTRAAEALLRTRGWRYPGTKVPLWIAAAFRQRERARHFQTRFLANNRRFPAAEALLRMKALPGPEKLLAGGPAPDSPAEALWYDDCAALAAAMLVRSGFRDGPGDADAALKKLAEGENFTEKAEEVVWTNLNWRSHELTAEVLETALKIRLPVLDAESNPTEKTEEVAAEALPVKLALRPDREQICAAFLRRIARAIPLLPSSLRPALRLVRTRAAKLGADPGSAPAFLAALAAFREHFRRFEERALFLDSFSGSPVSAAKLWRGALLENSAPGMLLAPEARRALRETEEMYIR